MATIEQGVSAAPASPLTQMAERGLGGGHHQAAAFASVPLPAGAGGAAAVAAGAGVGGGGGGGGGGAADPTTGDV